MEGMTMAADLWVAVLAAAVLSSALTLVGLLLAYRFFLRPRLEEMRQSMAAEVESRVRAGVEGAADDLLPRFGAETKGGFAEAGEELLPSFRHEVEAGFAAAAEEALPRLRAEVRGGFKEGLSEAVGAGLLGRRGGELARRGSSVLEAGINLLFGEAREDEEDDSGG
jgi:hypothetical protein